MFIACFPPSRCAKPIWAETHLSKTIWASRRCRSRLSVPCVGPNYEYLLFYHGPKPLWAKTYLGIGKRKCM